MDKIITHLDKQIMQFKEMATALLKEGREKKYIADAVLQENRMSPYPIEDDYIRELVEGVFSVPKTFDGRMLLDIVETGSVPIEWDIEGILPSQTKCLVCAAPKTGKSMLALELALSLASGEDFLQYFPVNSKKRVLFFEKEDSEHLTGARAKEIAELKKIDLSIDNIKFIFEKSFKLHDTGWIKILEDEMTTYKPDVLILDPLRRFHNFDENSSKDMDAICEQLDLLLKRFKCTIILIHHTRKQNDGDKSNQGAAAARGSSAIQGWAEVCITINRVGYEGPMRSVNMETKHGAPFASFNYQIADPRNGPDADNEDAVLNIKYIGESKKIARTVIDDKVLQAVKQIHTESKIPASNQQLYKQLDMPRSKIDRALERLRMDQKVTRYQAENPGGHGKVITWVEN